MKKLKGIEEFFMLYVAGLLLVFAIAVPYMKMDNQQLIFFVQLFSVCLMLLYSSSWIAKLLWQNEKIRMWYYSIKRSET